MLRKHGFTLVEILVFILLISVVFVAMTALTTYSIRSAKVSERTVLATHYAEELHEWLRGEKEVDWNAYIAKSAIVPGSVYCVNTIPASINGLVSEDCGSTYGIANTFKRDLTLTQNETETEVT